MAIDSELLGTVKAPSGIVVILDPGYLNLWCHDRPIGAPPGDVGPIVDLAIVGADAEAAGRAYNRQSNPRFLFDIPEKSLPAMEKLFMDYVKKAGLNATLNILPQRVAHRKRIDFGLAQGAGAACIQFHGLWACAVGGLAPERDYPLLGERMPDGPDTGRWKRVTLEVSTFPVAKSENIGHVMVDYARLAVACADGLGGWSHEEPLDGRADFVFWGLDAAKVAHTIGAPRLEDDQFGWENLDVYEAAARGQDVEKVRAQDDLKFATDFRPHSHNYELLRQVRVSTTESGVVAIGAAKLCGFATTWGDGIFPVYRDLAKDGSLVQVRIEVGNDQIVARQRAMDERYFGAFAKYALVSKRALEENRFIGWLYREKPHREDDSGWRLFVGDEKQEYLDVPDNIAIVPLRDLIDREKALEEVLRCLEGSAFERKAADAPFVRVPPKG